MLDLLRNERGAALLMAVGTLAVFAIVGTTLTYYTTRNAASAEISKSDSSAFALAEAGLHSALAVLSNPDNDPLDTGLLPETTTIFYCGRAVWSGTYSSGEGKWTITSTGYSVPSAGRSSRRWGRTSSGCSKSSAWRTMASTEWSGRARGTSSTFR